MKKLQDNSTLSSGKSFTQGRAPVRAKNKGRRIVDLDLKHSDTLPPASRQVDAYPPKQTDFKNVFKSIIRWRVDI